MVSTAARRPQGNNTYWHRLHGRQQVCHGPHEEPGAPREKQAHTNQVPFHQGSCGNRGHQAGHHRHIRATRGSLDQGAAKESVPGIARQVGSSFSRGTSLGGELLVNNLVPSSVLFLSLLSVKRHA
jgi:hypothetical protein